MGVHRQAYAKRRADGIPIALGWCRQAASPVQHERIAEPVPDAAALVEPSMPASR